jgi:hypothetical protein
LFLDLFIEFLVARQYRIFEIVAVDAINRDKLHTAVGLSIVKQDTVSILITVGALLLDKAVNLIRLL